MSGGLCATSGNKNMFSITHHSTQLTPICTLNLSFSDVADGWLRVLRQVQSGSQLAAGCDRLCKQLSHMACGAQIIASDQLPLHRFDAILSKMVGDHSAPVAKQCAIHGKSGCNEHKGSL